MEGRTAGSAEWAAGRRDGGQGGGSGAVQGRSGASLAGHAMDWGGPNRSSVCSSLAPIAPIAAQSEWRLESTWRAPGS